jgi:hypothetical protein
MFDTRRARTTHAESGGATQRGRIEIRAAAEAEQQQATCAR